MSTKTKIAGTDCLTKLRYYYWAFNIKIFKYWHQCDAPFPPDWLVIQINSVKPVSLKALVLSPFQSSTTIYAKNKVLKISLRILAQLKRYFGLQDYSVQAF
ncbi:hypothetical protein ILYODFUR_036693 [Ilyodon furcidens]|uniref:Uncharacterized protein n=1 Tax=Ilyodon furcidens TaxID=33524 RepID=A0ABV0UFJ9_9TELE